MYCARVQAPAAASEADAEESRDGLRRAMLCCVRNSQNWQHGIVKVRDRCWLGAAART